MTIRSCFIGLALALVAATPAAAAQITATATVNVVKPVSLTKVRDLSFGTITLASNTAVTAVISQAGVVTCPSGATCTGAPTSAMFNIQGTNKMTANITVPATTLSNGTDSIAFTPNAPASVYIPNTGAPGVDFNIGGSIAIGTTNAGGTYTGTITVTADYQ